MVEVSLCAAAMLVLRQDGLEAERPIVPLSDAELIAFRKETPNGHGRLIHLKPVLDIPGSPAFWQHPTTKLREDRPVWMR